MNAELKVIGGSDKTIRFSVLINGQDVGELQTDRADFTKLADKLLGDYILTTSWQMEEHKKDSIF